MAHANARTTVYARKLIVTRVLAGHLPGEVAKQLGVSRQTVYKWVRRWRTEGWAGLVDRSSRPHRMPRRTSAEATVAIVAARRAHHAGPVRLAASCARHDIELMVFSSDRVFDGRKGAPYLESDAPAPVSVLGRSQGCFAVGEQDLDQVFARLGQGRMIYAAKV